MRSLIEINHDYSDRATDLEVLPFLAQYLRSGSKEAAERLELFGLRVIGIRHHSSNYIVKGDVEGFPPQYLDPPKKVLP